MLPARGKSPALKSWKEYQDKPTTPMLASWFTGRGEAYNFWIATGQPSGVVVLDVDNDETLVWFRRQPGIAELLDATCCVKTGKGWHFYFRVEHDQEVASRSQHEEVQGTQVHWDLRGEGTGVIAPPSTHESGAVYAWVRGPDAMLPWNRWIEASESAASDATPITAVTGKRRRSQLAKLLEQMPSMTDGSGRNMHMTSIAGHIAKHIPHRDAYDRFLEILNREFGEALPDEEIGTIANSVWHKEVDKDVEGSGETGWLTEKDGQLWTLCRVKNGEEFVELWRPWGNFNLVAQGIVENDGSDVYVVDVVTPWRTSRALLSKQELGEWRKLKVTLAGYGCTVLSPDQEHPKAAKNDPGTRLHRWLQSQQPEHFRTVDHYGWHEGIGFVVHEGVITSRGLEAHSGVMPDPRIHERAPFRYGFVSADEARAVLSEVLTFHDPTVCAVFGAWWVASLLKPQIQIKASLFPFVALEAPSESGKTTGFFSLMLQLAGDTRGPGEYTLPVVRDRAGAHSSGIVWLDDLSDSRGVMDLLRQATSGGSRSKKGADKSSEETVKLVAPVVISGEGLAGITEEKALIDRVVKIDVPPVKGRMSLVNPEKPQWNDIISLRSRYPDLTTVAGTLVQLVLGQAGRIEDLPQLRSGAGRHADKLAILLVGATILSDILGDTSHLALVEAWCDQQQDIGEENYLTTTILPRLLRDNQVPRTPMNDHPVFVDESGIVWFNDARVADAWSIYRSPDARGRQLGTLSSIKAQRHALGVTGKGEVQQVAPRVPGTTWQRRHHALSRAVSQRVIARTETEIEVRESQRDLPEQPGIEGV